MQKMHSEANEAMKSAFSGDHVSDWLPSKLKENPVKKVLSDALANRKQHAKHLSEGELETIMDEMIESVQDKRAMLRSMEKSHE